MRCRLMLLQASSRSLARPINPLGDDGVQRLIYSKRRCCEPLGWSEKLESARKYMVHNVTLRIYYEQVSINTEWENLSN